MQCGAPGRGKYGDERNEACCNTAPEIQPTIQPPTGQVGLNWGRPFGGGKMLFLACSDHWSILEADRRFRNTAGFEALLCPLEGTLAAEHWIESSIELPTDVRLNV